MEFFKNLMSKIPDKTEEVLPKPNKSITFINPFTFNIALKNWEVYKHFDYIALDGILIVKLTNFLRNKKSEVPRISFDMTSLAPKVFTYAVDNNKSVYFIGASQSQIEIAVKNIKSIFPQLNVCGFSHGYISDDINLNLVANDIVELQPDVLIIGMGAPLQEKVSIHMRSKGYLGTIYTCGAFLYQTSLKVEYYPPIINKLHLRLPYRLYKEPHIISRTVKYYPIFMFRYLLLSIKHKIR